jgi:hypothetical protein
MNTLRIAGIALAIVASVVLVAGTLGVSSTTADRAVSVSVADDQNAFVGYDATDNDNVTTGDHIEILDIANRFEQPINVTDVNLDSGPNVSLSPNQLPEDIGPGDEAPVTASVEECTAPATEDISVTITVAGDGVRVELSSGSETVARSVEVSCAEEN